MSHKTAIVPTAAAKLPRKRDFTLPAVGGARRNRDFAPTAVGRPARKGQLRSDLDDLSGVSATSDLDLHIIRLLALHSTLKVRFRNQDLAALNDATKQTLLDDMNQVLGIRPLRKRKP